jgi:hypothetical protein
MTGGGVLPKPTLGCNAESLIAAANVWKVGESGQAALESDD